MSNLKTITATFEIVTPMFLGGADHGATRIRESSIKGALAFWWRALNYGRFVAAAEGDQTKALAAMQEKERELFGGPKGQGVFLLRVISGPDENNALESGKAKVLTKTGELHINPSVREDGTEIGVGARYLGYGVMEAFASRKDTNGPWNADNLKNYAAELVRPCFKQGISFVIRLLFRKSACDVDIKSVVNTLKLFGLLGGLGSRVRRGWGSVALVGLTAQGIADFDEWSLPNTQQKYSEHLQEIIGDLDSKHSGYAWNITAFAKETDIRVGTSSNDNPLTILDEIGAGLQRYRGWRGNGEQNFKPDHDWFRNAKGQPDYSPQRTAFGLPHNYSKRLGVTAADVSVDDEKITFDRRASPLFFHVHKLSNNSYFGLAMHLPNKFLKTENIEIVRNQNKSSIKYIYDTSIVTNFLEGKKPNGGTPTNGAYFPSTKVFP